VLLLGMQIRYPIDEQNILQEYPRPQMVRSSYKNLNGRWDCAICNDATLPLEFPFSILVPFSPETQLSTLQKTLRPTQRIVYRRVFKYHKLSDSHRLLLHFEAVDHSCNVYLNGELIGSHIGGYSPFTFDITKYLKLTNELIVQVSDPCDQEPIVRGKQVLRPKGIFYTGQSGIYQSVWLEEVPVQYIEKLRITSDLEKQCWYVQVITQSDDIPVSISYLEGTKQSIGKTNRPILCQVEKVHPWSPEDPFLYYFTVALGEDVVTSYVGLRSFSVHDGRLYLNGKPYFHHGILDQGYWPQSLYTPPTDQAVIDELTSVKKLGFNMIRKHAKVENRRWYHHCDVMGLLVWQDMVSGGRSPFQPIMSGPLLIPSFSVTDHHYKLLGSQDASYREQFETELREMIDTLFNTVSIGMWVVFNEGWGQFDAKRILEVVKKLDDTRTIDITSGWYDQGIGEFASKHVYFKKYTYKEDRLGRAVLLSEFGGYVWRVENHDDQTQKIFGYKTIANQKDFSDAFLKLYEEQVYPAKLQGLAASVYTQLTDVQQELNGLITFDRLVVKIEESTALYVASLLLGTENP